MSEHSERCRRHLLFGLSRILLLAVPVTLLVIEDDGGQGGNLEPSLIRHRKTCWGAEVKCGRLCLISPPVQYFNGKGTGENVSRYPISDEGGFGW